MHVCLLLLNEYITFALRLRACHTVDTDSRLHCDQLINHYSKTLTNYQKSLNDNTLLRYPPLFTHSLSCDISGCSTYGGYCTPITHPTMPSALSSPLYCIYLIPYAHINNSSVLHRNIRIATTITNCHRFLWHMNDLPPNSMQINAVAKTAGDNAI